MELKETEGKGRGLFARKFIPADTLLIKIEEEEFLTYNDLAEHHYFYHIYSDENLKKAEFAYFLAFVDSKPPNLILSDETKVKKYLNLIEPFNPNSLILWNEEELNILKN